MNPTALIIGKYSWRNQNVSTLAYKLAHMVFEIYENKNDLK